MSQMWSMHRMSDLTVETSSVGSEKFDYSPGGGTMKKHVDSDKREEEEVVITEIIRRSGGVQAYRQQQAAVQRRAQEPPSDQGGHRQRDSSRNTDSHDANGLMFAPELPSGISSRPVPVPAKRTSAPPSSNRGSYSSGSNNTPYLYSDHSGSLSQTADSSSRRDSQQSQNSRSSNKQDSKQDSASLLQVEANGRLWDLSNLLISSIDEAGGNEKPEPTTKPETDGTNDRKSNADKLNSLFSSRPSKKDVRSDDASTVITKIFPTMDSVTGSGDEDNISMVFRNAPPRRHTGDHAPSHSSTSEDLQTLTMETTKMTRSLSADSLQIMSDQQDQQEKLHDSASSLERHVNRNNGTKTMFDDDRSISTQSLILEQRRLFEELEERRLRQATRMNSSRTSTVSSYRRNPNTRSSRGSVSSQLNNARVRSGLNLQNSHSNISLGIDENSDQLLEISPGVKMPLRKASETWNAIQSNKAFEVTCSGCHRQLLTVPDAQLVLCPECRIVSPMPCIDEPTSRGLPPVTTNKRGSVSHRAPANHSIDPNDDSVRSLMSDFGQSGSSRLMSTTMRMPASSTVRLHQHRLTPAHLRRLSLGGASQSLVPKDAYHGIGLGVLQENIERAQLYNP